MALAFTRYVAMKGRPGGSWLSVGEIAEYLGVRPDTVCKRMPAHKAGRLWKFKTAEVDDWLRSVKRQRRKKEINEPWVL